MPRGARRRTSGLRREEVAALVGMSPDYYARLERGAGPQPSEQMVGALARGLRLSLAERDHLFALAGQSAHRRTAYTDHVGPALMRVLDHLQDTPAQVMGPLGETLAQTPLSGALFGDQTAYSGLARSVVYRWFTDLASREIYFAEDHQLHGRTFTAQLRQAVAQQGPRSAAADLARTLAAQSAEFAALWPEHEVGLTYSAEKRFSHPEVGRLDLHCQTLLIRTARSRSWYCCGAGERQPGHPAAAGRRRPTGDGRSLDRVSRHSWSPSGHRTLIRCDMGNLDRASGFRDRRSVRPLVKNSSHGRGRRGCGSGVGGGRPLGGASGKRPPLVPTAVGRLAGRAAGAGPWPGG